MRLSELRAMERTIAVPFGPHTITVTYKLDGVLAGSPGRTIPFLLGTLKAWDLEGDDGAPVPLTEAGFDQVPIPVYRAIEVAILADAAPGNWSGAR